MIGRRRPATADPRARGPRWNPGVLGACVCLAATLSACGGPGRAAPAELALEARRDALRAYLAAMEPDSARAPDSASTPPAASSGFRPLVPFDDVVMVVRHRMVERLIGAMLPFESVLDRRYRVRVDSASVEFRTGIAQVELNGRAALVDQASVFADVRLLGALEISTTPQRDEGDVPTLIGRVVIFGVDTRELRVATLSPPAERILDGLARLRVSELNRVLARIPIPISLAERIELPRVEEDEVTIPEGTLDAVFRLVAVRVLEEGIFVSLGVDRTDEAWPSVSITSLPERGG